MDTGDFSLAPHPIDKAFMVGFKGVRGATKAMAAEAIAEHAANVNISQALREVRFRDDAPQALGGGIPVDACSPYARCDAIADSATPVSENERTHAPHAHTHA